MPKLLKNHYSPEFVQSVAKYITKIYPEFRAEEYIAKVITNDWSQLELKQRMHRIAGSLKEFLPENYPESVDIVLQVAKNYSGLPHMCFPDYIEIFGLDDFDTSIKALEQLTEGCSSEFAIRPFILRYPEQTMAQMKQWAQSDSEHVRRLASEGCRPRLPWAMALSEFKKDPTEVLEVILQLIDDQSLYVRRSVANNLNDISKDNPDIVIEVAEKYLGKSKQVDWVIKHACRGLLKQGHKRVLQLFGYTEANHVRVTDLKIDDQIRLGKKLNFSFNITTKDKKLGRLRIEFIIDFMKANGKTSGKIFKISEGNMVDTKKSIVKYFSFKAISTRKYYLGEHQIHIVINGQKMKSCQFSLIG